MGIRSYFKRNEIYSLGDLLVTLSFECIVGPPLMIMTSLHYEGSDCGKALLGMLLFFPGLIIGFPLLLIGGVVKLIECPFKSIIKSI